MEIIRTPNSGSTDKFLLAHEHTPFTPSMAASNYNGQVTATKTTGQHNLLC